MVRFRLSKSKMLSGFQGPKRLYLEVHQPELAEVSAGTERLFSNGNLVGEIARRTRMHRNTVAVRMEDAFASLPREAPKTADVPPHGIS